MMYRLIFVLFLSCIFFNCDNVYSVNEKLVEIKNFIEMKSQKNNEKIYEAFCTEKYKFYIGKQAAYVEILEILQEKMEDGEND